MLVSFSFKNFKSFKDENRISLVAEQADPENTYSIPSPFGYSVLKTSAIYGANASGKSKFFEAFNFMCDVVNPPRMGKKTSVPVFDFWKSKYDGFRLSTQSDKSTSFFEVVFLLGKIQYRYGIELDKDGIKEEWLYRKKERETLILSRRSGNEGISKIQIKKAYINEKIYNNVASANMVSPEIPLVSLLATFSDPLSKEIVNWFKGINVVSANELSTPVEALRNDEHKKEIIAFMRAFDFNIEDLALHEINPDAIPEKIKSIIGEDALKSPVYDGVSTSHRYYNELYEYLGTRQFMMEVDESFGTNRLLRLSWPILNAIEKGSTLFIDEIDSGIHPYIISAIIKLFYMAKNEAQLIVNTQNTALLSYQMIDEKSAEVKKTLFRKDQIYIVNKNHYGESNIYPATHLQKDLRANLETIYLDGKLTGVPYVNLDNIIDLINHEPQG